MSGIFDLMVLGGGPAGYRAAEVAAAGGMKVLLVEKRTLGGVCLNEGCIPSKTLLHSAKIYDYAAKDGQKYGVKADGVTIDHAAVIARKNKVVKKLAAGIAAQLKAAGVVTVSGEGKILPREADGFKLAVGDEVYTGAKLLICTGSEAVLPPIDGLKEAFESGIALTNREVLALTELPKRLVVIGGGIIGLEMASYFNSVGSEVTVIEMLDKIAGPFDREISDILMKNYAKKGITFELSARVTALEGGRVIYEKDGGKKTVEGDKVLVSVGRRAVTKGFGLENLGVLTSKAGIETDEQMKTNIPGVFAAGDVNGRSMLAHTAYREAEAAVNVMLGKKDRMDYSAIPSVIYTNPEAASVGESAQTAAQKGLDCEEKTLSMNYSGRYMAENEGGNGICKLILEKGSGKLLGVSMLGNPCSEIIYGAAFMLGLELRARDIQRIVFPHPTVGEVIREGIF